MRNKISTKIIACVVLCSILISVAVGIIGIKVSTNVIKNEAYNNISNIAKSRGNEYSIEIEKTENTVKEYAKIISDAIDVSKINNIDYINTFENQFASLTKSIGFSNEKIVGLYINFNPELTEGENPYDLAYYSGEISYNSYTMDDYNESNEDLAWYYEPIKAKEGIWSKPYIDPESDNIKMISYTMPVYKDDKLIGVVGLDISYENLEKMILGTNLYDTGSAFLLDKDYTFLVDKNRTSEDNLSTMEDGQYNYIAEDIKNKKESVLEVNFQGRKTVIGYYTLSNKQIIGVKVPTDELLKSMRDLTFIMGSVIAIGVLISIVLALYISRKISKPIEIATKCIEKLSGLDLTDNDENINSIALNKDETGLMMKSLLRQKDELIKIIKVLKSNSLEVLEHTDIISTSSNETVESIALISATMEELSGRAEEQANEASNGLNRLNNLAKQIEEIVESISKLEQYSEDMQKVKEQGVQSINILNEKLEANFEAAMSVGDNIDSLLKKSNLIGEIITMISSISKQTSILALNASIESEKAGQSGKGFSVIAAEIRKLAERSAESTNEIQDIVGQIQKEISLGKSNMDNSKVALEEASNVMGISRESFNGIGESINNTMKQIKSLVTNIKKVDRDKYEVIVSIEEISLITEELALSVENVTKNINKQEVAMENTAERTEELKEVSKVLSKVVKKFKN
ncbi:methyl-accepting chemotaxis protein [Clostridium sp. SHJSY1]|uniref:methyl-accepting chemotaxis protein n=1 Tax=Clostridium sp. SHJSY1 TaxID=2942483 RepID=UPI0028762FB0|nr:methyl-accepting chemotaxis protein [Clostridium sp. SHJSY1]MDS0527632.1 methyl-accepting chemotaxis protein [Clostridium sp. SHJSY1]